MAVSFEQSIVNWLLLGGVVAILYGLRYLVVLERRMFSLERSVKKVIDKIEAEEREILMHEKLIGKRVIKEKTKTS